jgi:hypothetical protein
MLHEYHAIYNVRYYPRFHRTAVVLERITRGYEGITICIYPYTHLSDNGLGRLVSPFLQATKDLRDSRGIALLCF